MNEIHQPLSKRAVRRETWQALLNSWRQSGLTAKQFCHEHQLKEADLRRWSYRLNKEKRNQNLNSISTDNVANKFIPVTVSQATNVTENHHSIDIVLGKSLRLRVTEQFDEEMLLNLIQILRKVESC